MVSSKFLFNVFSLLFLMLLTLGTNFSKLQLWGPIHLYDLLLLFLFVISYSFKNIKTYLAKEVIIIFIVACIYLVVSIVLNKDTTLAIRQFMLFGYMFIGYILTIRLIKSKSSSLIRLIIFISIAAFILQFLFILYLVLFKSLNITSNIKMYYSPLVIMGLITFTSYSLIFIKNNLKKSILVFTTLILSYTTHHSSALLASACIIFIYIFIRSDFSLKILFSVCSLLLLIYINNNNKEFNDGNASWRKIYWKYSVDVIFNKNYALIGEGFGVRYAPDKLIDLMSYEIGSDHLGREDKAYVTPMHNSFLTIFFHIGFLFGVIILLPIFLVFFRRIKFANTKTSSQKDFLLLNVIGLSIWSSFNVILELPHSSLYYWLIFYLFYFLNYKEVQHIKKYTNETYEKENFNDYAASSTSTRSLLD